MRVSKLVLLAVVASGCGGEAEVESTEAALNPNHYDAAMVAEWNEAVANIAQAEDGFFTLKGVRTMAMMHLAMGDLSGAQAVFRNAPGEMGQPALVAYMATYNDLYWVLTDEQQKVLLRLPPSAFFDDPAAWGSVFMQTHWHRGDKARARAYADTAHMAFVQQLKGAPNDPQLHVLDGLALAYMGRKAEAIAQGEKGVSMLPISVDAQNGAYFQHQLARIYLMVGEKEQAIDMLEPLLAMPYYLSPGWLRIDPTFDPLRKNPRFQRLVEGTA